MMPSSSFRIGIAQINTRPADVWGNAQKIKIAYQELVDQGADLVLFPELALMGYWPGDHLLSDACIDNQLLALESIACSTQSTPAIIGCVKRHTGVGKALTNSAVWCQDGIVRYQTDKILLPHYDVFSEPRYFESGHQLLVVSYQQKKIALTICEDIWTAPHSPTAQLYPVHPITQLADQAVDMVLCLSASPWHVGHVEERLAVLKYVAQTTGAEVIYANSVGGHEELIFDGRSMHVNRQGELVRMMAAFKEQLDCFELNTPMESILALEPIADIYHALVYGIQEYVHKSGFETVIIGLSGGIDSAVVASLATHALGPSHVIGVSLPSAISSIHSQTDAQALAHALGIPYMSLPIASSVSQISDSLKLAVNSPLRSITQENIQARIRGLLLMSLANQYSYLLLATGNKSELAVGYCTLYGDMCGGLAPIGDLYKTQVYALAHYINELAPVIPISTLQKAPSAELAVDQYDADTLPPYDLLDAILKEHLEHHRGYTGLIQKGFDADAVEFVLNRVHQSEFKRFQAAPVLRVSARSFGIGRRIPLI